jgi:hypothetical protein
LYKAPAHYSMTISETNLTISSEEFPALKAFTQEDQK